MKNVICIILVILVCSDYSYSACIKGNCINGNGEFNYSNKATYIGTFKSSLPHGSGKLILADGSTYIGNFNLGNREGSGAFTFASGENYIGNFKNNQFSGFGKIVYRNGDIYTGTWLDGKATGQGTYTFNDGDVYEGGFLDGQFSGNGKLLRRDGSYYDGGWINSKKHGYGINFTNGIRTNVYYSFDKLTKKPINSMENIVQHFKEDKITTPTRAEAYWENCNDTYCHKQKGVYTFKDGSIYKGDFFNGKPQGIGSCMYTNGDKYEGFWVEGSPSGRGKWKRANTLGNLNINSNNKPSNITTKTYLGDNTINIYALIIGVANYDHLQSLKYTDDDAYHLYAFFKSPEGGAVPDDQITLLIDEAAKEHNITSHLQNIANLADSDDIIFVYMSGHGLDGKFIPNDFDGKNHTIEYDNVLKILSNSAAKQKVLIADACHSGSMVQSKSPQSLPIKNIYEAYAGSQGGNAILMSSKNTEVSLEYSGLRQGAFSHFLIKGLKGSADINNNKIITVTELYQYIAKNVKSYTNNAQNPLIIGDFDPLMPIGAVR